MSTGSFWSTEGRWSKPQIDIKIIEKIFQKSTNLDFPKVARFGILTTSLRLTKMSSLSRWTFKIIPNGAKNVFRDSRDDIESNYKKIWKCDFFSKIVIFSIFRSFLMDFLGFWSSQASIWGSENIKMTVLGAQMELWGRLQHNTVRESRYGPLGTEITNFWGTLRAPREKILFFFTKLCHWI